jgi:hypothetical protein
MLRGTVYTLTHEPASDQPTAVSRRVLELPATNRRDFERQAHAGTLLGTGQSLEFGPIGAPWGAGRAVRPPRA